MEAAHSAVAKAENTQIEGSAKEEEGEAKRQARKMDCGERKERIRPRVERGGEGIGGEVEGEDLKEGEKGR